jgi:hypothetical protein
MKSLHGFKRAPTEEQYQAAQYVREALGSRTTFTIDEKGQLKYRDGVSDYIRWTTVSPDYLERWSRLVRQDRHPNWEAVKARLEFVDA